MVGIKGLHRGGGRTAWDDIATMLGIAASFGLLLRWITEDIVGDSIQAFPPGLMMMKLDTLWFISDTTAPKRIKTTESKAPPVSHLIRKQVRKARADIKDLEERLKHAVVAMETKQTS